MAYDPEARKDSNTALIAGVAALILVIAAVAYFATRPSEVVDNTVVVTQPSDSPSTVTNTVIEQVPVAVDAPTAEPSTVVVQPSDRVIERNTTTNTTTNRTIVTSPTPNSGAPNGAAGRSSTNTNVTVNVPPPNSAPANDAAPAPSESAAGDAGSAPTADAPAGRESGY